jgi:RNA recognition motif-containing protein
MQEPKLFVGNLDFQTTSEELRTLFAQAGQVVSVSVPMDRTTGRPRGFAFVEFSTTDEASAALTKFNGYELSGRALRVNEAGEKPAPRAPRAFGSAPGGGGGDNGGGGFGFNDRPGFRPKPKGSRRNLRSRKRSIW